MQTNQEAARARILNEGDLTKLRSYAVSSHDGSIRNWEAIVGMMRDVDCGLSCFCLVLIVVGAFIVSAIRGLYRNNRNEEA